MIRLRALILGIRLFIFTAFIIVLLLLAATMSYYPHSLIIFGADKSDNPHYTTQFVSFSSLKLREGDVVEIDFKEPPVSSYFVVTSRHDYNYYDIQNRPDNYERMNISTKIKILDDTIRYPIPYGDEDPGFIIFNDDWAHSVRYEYRIINHPEIEFKGSNLYLFLLTFLLVILIVFLMTANTRRRCNLFIVCFLTYFMTLYILLYLAEIPTIGAFLSMYAILLVIFLNLYPLDSKKYKKIKRSKTTEH